MTVYLGSFPVRERGLKLIGCAIPSTSVSVVPRAGTWIETDEVIDMCAGSGVVPRAGTWIETQPPDSKHPLRTPSFPVRERGLKPGRTSGHALLA